ncbi:hypothetical protein HKX42_00050 [Salinisphaera sp. USBA-960]|nr:hypothetical protein [Salifodinibacter halophilus]NNC25283.1 hypothetical protein [Salifodinibacter halophilus]
MTSVAALSQLLGYRSNAVQNTASRGRVPYKEAAQLADKENVSLDYLIFGHESPGHGLLNPGDEVSMPANQGAPAPNADVLHAVVVGVESALTEAGVTLTPVKKADLISTLVDIYAQAHARPSRDHIMRLVRSAS